MNRPVDPWATAHDPTQPEVSPLGPGSTAPYPTVPVPGVGGGGRGPMYGRASVPVAKPRAEESEELALVAESPRRSVPPPEEGLLAADLERLAAESVRRLGLYRDGADRCVLRLGHLGCGRPEFSADADRRSRHHAARGRGPVRADPLPGVYRDRADVGPAPPPRSVGAPVHGAVPDVRRGGVLRRDHLDRRRDRLAPGAVATRSDPRKHSPRAALFGSQASPNHGRVARGRLG